MLRISFCVSFKHNQMASCTSKRSFYNCVFFCTIIIVFLSHCKENSHGAAVCGFHNLTSTRLLEECALWNSSVLAFFLTKSTFILRYAFDITLIKKFGPHSRGTYYFYVFPAFDLVTTNNSMQ